MSVDEPAVDPASTVPVDAPTVQDVANLLRARTKDASGLEVGTFTADTRPTEEAVGELIVAAQGDVLAQTGDLLYDVDAAAATVLISLRAAMLVELSYFPEQVRSDRSAYVEYKRLYDEGLAALVAAIHAGAGGAGEEMIWGTFGSLPILSPTRTPDAQAPPPPLP